MSATIKIHAYGGPDVLHVESLPVGTPAAGEVRLRQTTIGVNYHDIYVRSGLYDTLALPGTPGIEGVGVIDAVGEGVEDFAVGERIGYVSPEYGAYAAVRLLPARRAVRLPEKLDDVAVAGGLMKALTACMLLRKVHGVSEGDTILVHAAAGGMGQMLCRWASELGARVIGTVGTSQKAIVARAAGAHDTILYRQEDFADRVMAITNGMGVAAVYDSVGHDSFLRSLQCLDYGGKLVLFGQSSGAVSPFAPALLAARSASVHRPIVFHYIRDASMLRAMMGEVTAAFERGALAPLPAIELPLAQAAEAHRILEAGASPGAVVLRP